MNYKTIERGFGVREPRLARGFGIKSWRSDSRLGALDYHLLANQP